MTPHDQTKGFLDRDRRLLTPRFFLGAEKYFSRRPKTFDIFRVDRETLHATQFHFEESKQIHCDGIRLKLHDLYCWEVVLKSLEPTIGVPQYLPVGGHIKIHRPKTFDCFFRKRRNPSGDRKLLTHKFFTNSSFQETDSKSTFKDNAKRFMKILKQIG